MLRFIAGQYRFDPEPRCQICGNTQDLRHPNKHITGNGAIICMDCFFVWYDQGLTNTQDILSASLKRQGRKQ